VYIHGIGEMSWLLTIVQLKLIMYWHKTNKTSRNSKI